MHLYITATPIGNLDDMSFRAVETLKTVDVILCEDTRITRKLTNHFNIDTPLKSYHDFNKETIEDSLIEEMLSGTVYALVSDAGMPLISDPGYELIRRMQDEGLKFSVIPGPSAFVSAVVASGIPSYDFTFYGFLPKSKQKKIASLDEILKQTSTSVLYESPHQIKDTVKRIATTYPDREISISREITKKFEQHMRGSAENILKALGDEIPIKGEFVIVISGATETSETSYDMDIETHVEMFIEDGMKPVEAIKHVAQLRGLKKQEVYDEFHKKNP